MTLLHILGFFAAGQGLFQVFLIWNGLKIKSKDQILLGLIIGFLSLSVLEYVLLWSGNMTEFSHLIGFSSIAQFLFLPLIYSFFKISKGEKVKYWWLHFIFFAVVLFSLSDFLLLSGNEKMLQINTVFKFTFSVGVWNIPLCMVFCTQCLLYLFLINSIKNRKQSILSEVLYRIFVVYISVHLFHTSLIYFLPAYIQKVGIGILSTSIISIYVLSYYSYLRGQIIKEEKLPKYYHSILKQSQTTAIVSALNDFLKKENYFTNSDIRMAQVAHALNVSSAHLSQSINQELNCSFRTYLNGLRISYAEGLIEKEKNNRISLKEVAFNSGFNNKTSFANAFKKKNNMTPSQYVQMMKGVS